MMCLIAHVTVLYVPAVAVVSVPGKGEEGGRGRWGVATLDIQNGYIVVTSNSQRTQNNNK